MDQIEIPKWMGIGIAAALLGLMVAAFWWRTGGSMNNDPNAERERAAIAAQEAVELRNRPVEEPTVRRGD
jgi:hypothetical protein